MAEYYCGSTKYAAVTQWAASTAYTVGALRRQLTTPTVGNERVFRCTTAGTSSASEPSWSGTPVAFGNTVNDGSVVWTNVTGLSTYGWTAAAARITYCHANMEAGDILWLSNNHSESTSSLQLSSSNDDGLNPRYTYCVDDAASPPTALATGATLTATSGLAINGANYCYGIAFVSSSNIDMGFGSEGAWIYLKNCSLRCSTASGRIQLGGTSPDKAKITWDNTTVQFANAGQSIFAEGVDLHWKNTASAIVVGTLPTRLFLATTSSGQSGKVVVEGVDLSALTSSQQLTYARENRVHFTFANCRIANDVPLVDSASAMRLGGSTVKLINCDNADTQHRYASQCFEGTCNSETTIVRSGGATNGTTPFSRKLVSSNRTVFENPLESEPIAYWNEDVGSPITITVEIVNDGVTLTDADVWLDVSYLGTSGYPLWSGLTDRKTNYLSSSANQTSSSETWTTTGLSSPIKQKLEVTITPQEKGMIQAVVCLARASTTLYYDPVIVSGTTRQFSTLGGVLSESGSTGDTIEGTVKAVGFGGGLVG